MPRATDREMPKRKRCKRDVDRIHSKILKAKKKLDNDGKNGEKDKQRKQGQAKICTRLLPRSAFGIYRNGTKGKNIYKETSESTFDRARLKADALKLFNGDTPEVKYTEGPSTYNETTEQLESNKDFVKNSLKFWTPNSILEQSPVLKRKQRMFDNFVEENGVNEDKIQQTHRDDKNISKALNHYKDLCKMISDVNFGGDFLQNYQSDPLTTTIKKLKCTYSNSLRQRYLREKNKLETVKSSALSVENQACTYSDASQMSPAIEYEVPKCSENRTISPFLLEDIPEQDDKIHSMQSDNVEPYDSISCLSQTLETYDINDCIIRNRKNDDNQYSKQSAHIYQSPRTVNSVNEKDSIQKHYINHPSKNKRHNKNNLYVDFSDHENLQCIDNRKHAEILTFSNDLLLAEKYLSRDTCEKSPINFSNRVINKCNAKNVKRPVIHRYNHVTAMKDNHSAQKNDDLFYKMNYAEKLYKQFGININNKRDNERHAYVDSFHQQKNKQELETVKLPDLSMKYQACSDVSQVSSTSFFKIDSEIPKYRENHTIAFPLIKDTSQKENKFHWMQKRITPYNDITKESYEAQFPNGAKNFPTPSIINSQFFHDGTKMFKPRIESMNMEDSQESLMNIKESQESLIEKFDLNMHSNKLTGRNRVCRFDDSLQTFETLYNTNAYTERTRGREQVLSKVKNQLFHSHNYHAINLRDANSCNFNIKSTKLPAQQAKLHICENNDAKQELLEKSLHNRNKNILFNAKAIPSSTLNFSQIIQPDQRFRESTCKEIFNKADVECAKNQIDLNHCNEQYIYLDSTRCQHNASQEHHFHKGAVQTIVQPRILHEDRDNKMDNCINLSTDVSLLLVEPKKNSAYTYPKMIDDQHHSVQNITQPIKYVAVNNNSDIQRIPIYISDNSIRENVPLEIITLVKPNAQTEELYFHKKYHLCKQ
ncbi:hypothetical protein EAG_00651 [Camponotus floridanus]|uniref:Uncharacterized protein n=1 Tax=Camponotus floridanus TaxID=104421 RepID=E2A7K5_CAMFO|nr:uncharacterized protein LOC105249290 isoform X2 [Camponotus floridanus]EFN70577.1 hypothetical protein EAG_00651 [Camponotus floridanus]